MPRYAGPWMSSLICSTWRRCMKQACSVRHRPSLRLPLKIGRLFDTGFAGDILDVASMHCDAPAVLSGSTFSPGLDSANKVLLDPLICDEDVPESLFNSLPSHLISSMDEHFATDLLAADSLDAFLNLDRMLVEDDALFNEIGDVNGNINLLNTIPSADKMIYSLAGAESISFTQPSLLVFHNQETISEDINNNPVAPFLSEQSVFDSVMKTVYNPRLNREHACKQAPQMATSVESINKCVSPSFNDVKSNLCSFVPSASSNGKNVPIKKVTNRQTVSIKGKGGGVKKSKEKRRSKFYDLEEEAEVLIQENEKLKRKITELEKLTKEMKAKLVATIAGKYPPCS